VAVRKARTGRVLKKGAEKMYSLKPVFNNESSNSLASSLFWLMLLTVLIDNDRQRKIEEHKQKARCIQEIQAQSKIKKIQPAFRP